MSETQQSLVVNVETKGGKLLGITAFIFSIIAFFAPFIGLFVGILSCLLAIYPAFTRTGKIWALVVSLLNAVNAFVFTPSFWISLKLSSFAGSQIDQGVLGAKAASSAFGFFPWLWLLLFIGLFAIVVMKYISDSGKSHA